MSSLLWKMLLGAGGGASQVAPTLILDNFADTNGVLLTDHVIAPTNTPATAWANLVGTQDIQSNRATLKTITGAICGAVVDAGEADVTVSGIINIGSTIVDDHYGTGFILRATDLNNLWWCVIRRIDTNFSLYERNASVDTVRATIDFTPTVNTEYALEVVCSGNTITATLDGANQIQYASATFQNTATLFGIRHLVLNLPVTKPYVDTFQVTAP